MSRVRVPSPALLYKDLQVISKSHYWACVPFVYPEAFSVFSKTSEKYPNTPIYSIREIEALEGLETVEQRLLQEAKQIFGGHIFSEELFNKHYPKRKVKNNGKK